MRNMYVFSLLWQIKNVQHDAYSLILITPILGELKMSNLTQDQILEAVSNMTVMDIVELVKKWKISLVFLRQQQ